MLLLLLVLLAGAILPFAFAPFGIYTFAFVSPAILAFSWLEAKKGQAFLLGLFFGIGFFGIGTSWIYISIHDYGNASIWLAGLITILFVCILSLYPATLGWVFSALFGKKSPAVKCLLAFPALFVVWEVLRSHLFTGFPWLLLGYSQTNSWVGHFAPYFGVYGVSLAVAFVGGALALLALRTSYKIKFLALGIILIVFFGGLILSKYQWTHPVGKKFKVSLMQGNIAQKMKWVPGRLAKILNIYQSMTQPHWDSHLIIWPEAAIPTFPQYIPGYIQLLSAQAKKHNTYLLFGIPLYHPKTHRYYNGMLMVGAGQGQYLKRHLVPFGEYVPLKSIFGTLMKSFNVPMSNFSAGPWQQPAIKIGKIKLATFICYEIAFPREVLNSVIGKQLIVTITDDSWFGRSIALAQHMQMAQMQALKTGRYLLLDSNSGISAFINPQGKVYAGLPIDKRAVLTNTVQAMEGNTPLMWWHYYPLMALLILLLIGAFLTKPKKQPPAKT